MVIGITYVVDFYVSKHLIYCGVGRGALRLFNISLHSHLCFQDGFVLVGSVAGQRYWCQSYKHFFLMSLTHWQKS